MISFQFHVDAEVDDGSVSTSAFLSLMQSTAHLRLTGSEIGALTIKEPQVKIDSLMINLGSNEIHFVESSLKEALLDQAT
jgi:hypothetical protein